MNVFISIDQHGRKQVCVFLPRDAVVACPSDRLSQSVLYRNEIRAGFGMEVYFHLSHTVL